MWRRRLRVVAWFFSNWLTWSKTCSIMASCRKSSLPPLNCTEISNDEYNTVGKAHTNCLYLCPSLPMAVTIFGALTPVAIVIFDKNESTVGTDL
jgi:hypothetical protein